MFWPTLLGYNDSNMFADAACHGRNHHDTAVIGLCSRCGAEVANVKHEGRKPHLAPLGWGYSTPRYNCWQIHRCDPDRIPLWEAAVAERRARGEIFKGDRAVVVKGRKVPKGTEGTVWWIGENDWGTLQAMLVTDDGTKYYLAMSNLEPVKS